MTPRSLSLGLACAYFLPAFLWRDQNTAFYTYALAHGLQQYLVIMSYVARRAPHVTVDGPARSRPGMPTVLACIATLGIVLAITGDTKLIIDDNIVAVYVACSREIGPRGLIAWVRSYGLALG